ncbi:MAG: hypothetical protein ABIF88_03820 [archaeon]
MKTLTNILLASSLAIAPTFPSCKSTQSQNPTQNPPTTEQLIQEIQDQQKFNAVYQLLSLFEETPTQKLQELNGDRVLYHNGKVIEMFGDRVLYDEPGRMIELDGQRVLYDESGTLKEIGGNRVLYHNGKVTEIFGDRVLYRNDELIELDGKRVLKNDENNIIEIFGNRVLYRK